MRRAFLLEQKARAVSVRYDGPRIEHQDCPYLSIMHAKRLEYETDYDARDVSLQNVEEEEGAPIRPDANAADDLHVIQALFLFMDDP